MTRNLKTSQEEIHMGLPQHSRPPTTGRTTSHQELSKRDRDQDVRFDVKDGDKLLQGDLKHEEQESA